MPEVPQKKINELELTVRTIDEMLPDMPTKALQKWQGILRTALLKVEKELTATYQHTCKICFFQEYGYRDELPSFWYKKGDATICFKHEYKDSEKLLKDAGYEVDAFFPPEIPAPSVEGLKVTMDHLPPPKTETDHTLEELMELI
jgi:hypothetical protein